MRIILLFYFFFIVYVFQAQENFSLVLKSKINYNDSIQIAKGYDGYNFYYYNNSIIKRNLESTFLGNMVERAAEIGVISDEEYNEYIKDFILNRDFIFK